MAETRAELLARAAEIRDETRRDANTPLRVGGALWEIIDSMVLGTFDNPVDPTDDGKMLYASAGAWTKTAAPTAAGQVQRWTGAVWAPGALNLADTDAVTGLLALANVTGGSAVGQVLRNAAGNVPEWGAVDLADTDAVTGILPAANGGTGLAAPANPADDNKMLRASGGAWVMTSDVKTDGSTFISIGADPADNGAVRLINGLNGSIQFEANPAGTDVRGLYCDSSNILRLSDGTAAGLQANLASGNFTIQHASTTSVLIDSSSMRLPFGGNVASSGTVRVANGFLLNGRDFLNANNLNILNLTTSDNLVIGQATSLSLIEMRSATQTRISIAGSTEYDFQATHANFTDNEIRFTSSSTGGKLNVPHGVTALKGLSSGGGASRDLIRWGTPTTDGMAIGFATMAGLTFDTGSGTAYTLQVNSTPEYSFSSTQALWNQNSLEGVGFASFGATPAASGALRLTNNTSAIWRTSGGADAICLQLGATDILALGDATNVASVRVSAAGNVALRPTGAGSDEYTFSSTTLNGFFNTLTDWASIQLYSGGGSPAASGLVRLSNNQGGVKFRKADNTDDMRGMDLSSANVLNIGETGFADVTVTSTNFTTFKVLTNNEMLIAGTYVLLYDNTLTWSDTYATPTIQQQSIANSGSPTTTLLAARDDTGTGNAAGSHLTVRAGNTAGNNGAWTAGDLTLQAGDSTGAAATHTAGAVTLRGGDATGGSGTRTGGNLTIRAGTGATANGTLSLMNGATNRIQINGTGIGFFAATPVAQQTDIGALTDNIAGTVNTTLDAIPNPADAPATADALRDDLVANALPQIRDALSTLASQINAIRTRQRNLGLMA